MSRLRIPALAATAIGTLFALAGCVPQQTYEAQVQKTDALQQRYDQLNQQMS